MYDEWILLIFYVSDYSSVSMYFEISTHSMVTDAGAMGSTFEKCIWIYRHDVHCNQNIPRHEPFFRLLLNLFLSDQLEHLLKKFKFVLKMDFFRRRLIWIVTKCRPLIARVLTAVISCRRRCRRHYIFMQFSINSLIL